MSSGANFRRESRRPGAWLIACGLLGGGAVLVGAPDLLWLARDNAPHPLAWDAVGWVLRPWTLWTAAWVPDSAGSLAANLLAFTALAVLGAWLRAGQAAALSLLLAWPLGTAALLLWPEVTHYRGLGGPVHAAAMALWADLAFRSSTKPLSFALFAGMGLKLLLEHGWTQPVAFDPSWGFNVVYAAHLTGALAGAASGLVLAAALLARGR